jgi:hypothetical protein
LGHVIGAKQIHREEPFERGAIAEVVLERNTGIVDEDIESVDSLDGCPNLRRIGNVQRQGRDAAISMGKGLARAGIDPLRPSRQSLLNQCFSDAAIGSSHQSC